MEEHHIRHGMGQEGMAAPIIKTYAPRVNFMSMCFIGKVIAVSYQTSLDSCFITEAAGQLRLHGKWIFK